jgi:hypothetical protein
MLEKVWAKASGNFDFIVAGSPTEAYDFILGCPTIAYDINDASTIAGNIGTAFSIVSYAYSMNYIMGASTNNTSTYGLATDHAYSILGTYVVAETNTPSKIHKLYRMRNPWGTDGSFSGSWKEGASNWNLIKSASVGYVANTNDGVFYLEDFEFVQAYSGIYIGYYNSTNVNNYLEVRNDNYANYYFEFTLT